MCSSKTPAPQTPAPAPPPLEDPAMAPVVDETASSVRNTVAAGRRGRNSLRIDRSSNVPGSGSSGLTIY